MIREREPEREIRFSVPASVPAESALPTLAPEEHRWIEERVGRSLTNDEAQLALREATIQAAFAHWTGRKDGE